MSPLVLVFGRRQRRDGPRAQLAGVQKAPRHEVAGGWALTCSELCGFDVGADLDYGQEAGTRRRHVCILGKPKSFVPWPWAVEIWRCGKSAAIRGTAAVAPTQSGRQPVTLTGRATFLLGATTCGAYGKLSCRSRTDSVKSAGAADAANCGLASEARSRA